MMPLPRDRMTERLIETLHVEAMVLADEARAYFDEGGREERDALPPVGRVAFACESLKITTRLMHVIAWLIARRGDGGLHPPPRPLGRSPETDPSALSAMPETARALIRASLDLHGRVERLDRSLSEDAVTESPALHLLGRLRQAF